MSKLIGLIFLLASGWTYASGGGGGGGGFSTGDASVGQESRPTPEQRAERAHDKGLKYRKYALGYEERAAAAKDDKERAKRLADAKDAWQDAIKQYERAIALDASRYQSLNELGYALRKTGDYKASIEAYNKALALKSDYAPAIEYRGEAFLAMESFKEVQDAYMRLVKLDHDQAALLFSAIKQWTAAHQDVTTDEAKAFVKWAGERNDLAQLLPGTVQRWAP